MEILKEAWNKRLIMQNLEKEQGYGDNIVTHNNENVLEITKDMNKKERMQNIYNQELRMQIELFYLKKDIFSIKQLKLCIEYMRNLINEARDFELILDNFLIAIFMDLEHSLNSKENNTQQSNTQTQSQKRS